MTSGGEFRLTADPIDVGAVIAAVADERAGAIATFLGTTRVESRGRAVNHRDHALAACKEAIDRLKVDVPLWKKEVYEGGEEWIGRGS